MPSAAAAASALPRRGSAPRAPRDRAILEHAEGAICPVANADARPQFGIGRAWVFGSLTEGDHFSERSDIDMAASDLTPALHMEALGRLLRLSPDFAFDLVDLDHCPPGLRRAVEDSAAEP